MSKLKELINKLCPNGVEYRKLSELCNAKKKGTLKTSDLKMAGKYPVINSGRELYGFYDEFNNKNAITFAARGEYAGYISYFEDEFWAGGLCYPYSSKDEKIITNKFLYYYLKSKEKTIMETLVVRGSIPALNKTDLEKFMLPVPPIEVQEEIVRILDNFTNLQAELVRRIKQYEHVRNVLLNSNKYEYISVCLEEILKIKNGKDYKHLNSGEYPIYGSGGIIGYVDEYVYDKPSVLIPRKGSIDKLYYVDKPFWNVDTIFYTEINEEKAIAKYVYYCLENIGLEKLNTGAGVPSLTQAVLNKVKINLPPIHIQEKIVYVLDNFEKVCKDLNIGLPAEIKERQKQYGFYRNLLLTFPNGIETILKKERDN